MSEGLEEIAFVEEPPYKRMVIHFPNDEEKLLEASAEMKTWIAALFVLGFLHLFLDLLGVL